MIDLSLLNNKTFDIKLQDGEILNIRKPNNQLLSDTFKMIALIEANGEEKSIINAIYLFLTKIMNRNINGIKFTQNAVEEMLDIDAAMYVIKEYYGFVKEVLEAINF